jgi:hypothetical protein
MAALSSVSSKQCPEVMAKCLHSFSDRQIQGMASLVATVVAAKGALQFKEGATFQHQDDSADIIQLDVLTKLTVVTTNYLVNELTENIRNGALSVFAKGKKLECTFRDILDASRYLQEQIVPSLYFNFLITINIQIKDKETPVLVFIVAEAEKEYRIDF